MSEPGYGLERIAGNDPEHAVVLLHGIMQTRDSMRVFGNTLANHIGKAELYLYGYDHTRGLEENGEALSKHLHTLLHARVDLVGYSMGGLVARLAASAGSARAVDTVVTLATPNRGAMSNAQLHLLGQLVRQGFELISPLFPRSEGVKDLTRVPQIMRARYDRLESQGKRLMTRYVSIPALFYHRDRSDIELGPSGKMASVYTAMYGLNLYRGFTNMTRAHDGIVTEDSNNLTARTSSDFNETLLAVSNQGPACAHATISDCTNDDHQSILRDKKDADLGNAPIAALIGLLLHERDWSVTKAKSTSRTPVPQIFIVE